MSGRSRTASITDWSSPARRTLRTNLRFVAHRVLPGADPRSRAALTGAGHPSRWRHLDLGASRLYLEAEVRRLRCSTCEKVLTEEVPWARPRARHTRDFEDVVAWCA